MSKKGAGKRVISLLGPGENQQFKVPAPSRSYIAKYEGHFLQKDLGVCKVRVPKILISLYSRISNNCRVWNNCIGWMFLIKLINVGYGIVASGGNFQEIQSS